MIDSYFLKKKVVIYARVSTEHEAQLYALENQVDWYKPILAARPEWELIDYYVDEGITGTSAEKRPQFQKMIKDAKKHKFDMIITREVSRFARNTVDTLQYTRELKSIGVEVFFINDNIKTFDGDGELRLTIMATLAQDESRKTSIRVKSGLKTSMENGVIFGNGNILGYDRIGKEMVVNPEQAETVRMIYDLYLDGYGIKKIAEILELRGRLTSTGMKRWNSTVVSGVLKNTFYHGVITYHKQFVPDYLTQKKIRNYGDVEVIQVEGTHEKIVTKEEYERVQRIMESKRHKLINLQEGRLGSGVRPKPTVWGRLLECSCGREFSRRVWKRHNGVCDYGYLCYSSVQKGSYESRKKKGLSLDGICNTPMVPEWKLQMMANYIFKNYISDKEKVLSLANSMLEAHIGDTREITDNSELIEVKQTELEKLNRKFDNLVEMRAEGSISKEMFKSKADEIEKRSDFLRKEIEGLAPKDMIKTEENYEEKLTLLRYALEQYTNWSDGDVSEYVIEAYVSKIVVSKESFDWYFRFGGNPDDPLHCHVDGKRRTTAKISVQGDNSPCRVPCDSGCTCRVITTQYI